MMLPILISVSLAPGSYFFCALAEVATAAATANAVRARKLGTRTGIVFSRLFVLPHCRKPSAGWQAAAYSARSNRAIVRRRVFQHVLTLLPSPFALTTRPI